MPAAMLWFDKPTADQLIAEAVHRKQVRELVEVCKSILTTFGHQVIVPAAPPEDRRAILHPVIHRAPL